MTPHGAASVWYRGTKQAKAFMRVRGMRWLALLTGLLLGGTALATPQQVAESSQIVVTGTGSVAVDPDRARVLFSIESRAANPAEAADSTARIQAATVEALRGAGVEAGGVTSVGYSVSPDWRHDEHGNRELAGYVATSSVLLQTSSLDRVGGLIDVALSAGVTGVRSVMFEASDVDAARRQALAAATEQARLDAEAIARAAGGRLGRLVEITLDKPEAEPGVVVRRYYTPPSTQLEPGQQFVTATIIAAWRFENE